MHFPPDYSIATGVVPFFLDHIGEDLSPIMIGKIRQLAKIIPVPKPIDGFGPGSEVPPG
jgi:hypothetical protein